MEAAEFAEKYGMSVQAAASTLAAYAAEPDDEQWRYIDQGDLSRGAMEDLSAGVATIVNTPGWSLLAEKFLEDTRGPDVEERVVEYITAEELKFVTKDQEILIASSVVAYNALQYPGEYESMMQGAVAELELDNPSFPWLALGGILLSLVLGSTTVKAALLAIGAIILGYLIGVSVGEDQAVYIGNRLAGIVRGEIKVNTARAFGMKRMISKRASGEGHQVAIIRGRKESENE